MRDRRAEDRDLQLQQQKLQQQQQQTATTSRSTLHFFDVAALEQELGRVRGEEAEHVLLFRVILSANGQAVVNANRVLTRLNVTTWPDGNEENMYLI